jgi:uncharacterized protein (UPF0303 family)
MEEQEQMSKTRVVIIIIIIIHSHTRLHSAKRGKKTVNTPYTEKKKNNIHKIEK